MFIQHEGVLLSDAKVDAGQDEEEVDKETNQHCDHVHPNLGEGMKD